MTLLEKCIFKLFETGESKFLIYLLKKVPNVSVYLHEVNPSTGWLPLFRVLNMFLIKEYKCTETEEKTIDTIIEKSCEISHEKSTDDSAGDQP